MTGDEILPKLQSVWDKLDANLSAIYRDYLYEREHGTPPDVRFHRPVAPDGRLHVSLTYTGELATIEGLGFETISRRRQGGSASGYIDLGNLERLAEHPGVVRFTFGNMPRPTLSKSIPDIGANQVWNLVGGQFKGNAGQDVVIGILDSGIDFLSELFDRTPEPNRTTRILSIWDQTLRPIDAERSPDPKRLSDDEEEVTESYGVEYPSDWINKVLQESPGAAPVHHVDDGGHGTVVTAIAAGNGGKDQRYVGVAPRANLIIVNVLTKDDRVNPEVRFRHAVNYVIETAKKLKPSSPVVINGSFGDRLSAHDGLSASERFLDWRLAGAKGLAYVAAAGNEGGFCRHPTGILNDRAHQHARISFKKDQPVKLALELRDVLTHYKLGLGPQEAVIRRPASIAIYYPLAAELTFSINFPHDAKSRKGPNLGDPVKPPEEYSSWRYEFRHEVWEKDLLPLRCNQFMFWITASKYGQYRQGDYAVTVSLNTDGDAHIYFDAVDLGGFRLKDVQPPGVDLTERYLIGSPGGARNVITVASYDHDRPNRPVWSNSSRGPLVSWNGTTPLEKPDIAAPGVRIVTATGGGILDEEGASGTSAAAPHVAGAIALVLQEKPHLSVDEIRAALGASARKDPTPVKEEVGAGRLNAFEAVKKVKP